MKLAIFITLLICGHSDAFRSFNTSGEMLARFVSPFFNTEQQQVLIYNLLVKKCASSKYAKIYLGDCQDPEKTEFDFIRSRGNIYQIKKRFTNDCLEVQNNSEQDGAAIQLGPCSNQPNQEILLQDLNTDSLYKKIIFTHSGKCLDVMGPHQWTCGPWSSQNFLIAHQKNEVSRLPKIIWSYWDTGQSRMPDFYQSNVAHWKRILGDDWSVRVVNRIESDEYYFGRYVLKDQIPDLSWIRSRIGNKEYEKKLNSAVIQSDFVRLELLARYGGVWMDPSVMLHRNLSDVQVVLESFDDFEVLGFTSQNQANSELRYADSLENFFVAALPNSQLVHAWKSNFRRYWDKKQPGMAIENNPMYSGIQDDEVDTSQFGQLSNYLNQHAALKYTLIKNMEYLRKVFIFGDALLEDKGPFSLLQLVGWNDAKLIALRRNSIEQILRRMKDVLISKFPSENSKNLRQKNEAYFWQDDNIFGQLNQQPEIQINFRETSCPELDIPDDSYVLPSGPGVTIRSHDGDQCLTVRSKNDGGTLRMQRCTGHINQLFEEISLSNSKKIIRSLFSCKCLDIEGQSLEVAVIHQWHCHAGGSQQIQKVQNTMLFEHSGKCLDVVVDVMQETCVEGKLSQQLGF